ENYGPTLVLGFGVVPTDKRHWKIMGRAADRKNGQTGGQRHQRKGDLPCLLHVSLDDGMCRGANWNVTATSLSRREAYQTASFSHKMRPALSSVPGGNSVAGPLWLSPGESRWQLFVRFASEC